MRIVTFIALAAVGFASPALAQDRTPPVTDLRAYSPPVDWRASPAPRPTYEAIYSGRSVAIAHPAHHRSIAE